jgi:hypothetical protein
MPFHLHLLLSVVKNRSLAHLIIDSDAFWYSLVTPAVRFFVAEALALLRADVLLEDR